jgi:hypothetical protein
VRLASLRMGRARIIKGVGRETNPFDGDRVVIELGVRDGKLAYIGANDIRTGGTTWVGEIRQEVTFKTGAEARAKGDETFAGCETARNAALALPNVFIGRELEEALAIDARDLIAKMDLPPGNERCVRTVLAAARNALIDVQVTTLAEAIVEVRRLRDTA